MGCDVVLLGILTNSRSWFRIMLQQSTRMVNLLAETLYDLDVREAPRFDCPTKPTLRIMVRPSFVPVNVTVNDISSKGIGLVCEKHLESGADLAVLWKYGTADRWRTLRARVVRLAPRRDGTWVAGCVFAEPLQPDDMEAILRIQPDPPSMLDE
jgi:PilZ domain